LIPHALILTAGLGTRLRPLTDERAKPAMPVGGEALVRRIIGWLHGHGVTELVLNLHHRPATLTSVVGDGSDLGVRVRYSWEGAAVLGSAGGPRHALPIVGADTFLLINGDTLTDVDLAALAAAHVAGGALATLAVVPNTAFTRYGGVLLDDQDRVIGFSRRGQASRGSWHFIGVQAVNASAFGDLPDGVPMNTIGGLYDELIRRRKGSVRAYRCSAAFWDVGTAADYLATSHAFTPGGIDAGRRVRIDPSAQVRRSILWDDVDVGAGADLADCIVTDGAHVPAGARYERVILQWRADDLVVTPIES
jgi:mannose-1-phosphate guanylyltransferase